MPAKARCSNMAGTSLRTERRRTTLRKLENATDFRAGSQVLKTMCRIRNARGCAMKFFFPTTLITFCLLIGCAVGVRAQSKQDEGPMTNAEVIKLVKAGFKEKTVVLIIASRIPNFDLTSDRMIELKRKGVSENIIVAMLARQEGTDMPDDSSWGDDPFFNSKADPKGSNAGGAGGDKGSAPSDGSTNIFGSSAGTKQSTRTRTGNAGGSGDSQLTGSATVRILKP